jgi:CRP/FNR family cyclic AMP-dependent transcriptional regulator
MFHTPIESRVGLSSSLARLLAFGEQPLQFPAAMDLCRERVPAAMDDDALRFAAEARRSSSRHAFRPAFTAADWRVFSSFCIASRLPTGFRVLIPGHADRTLRLVVEGSLWRESAATTRETPIQAKLLLPGTILGADALFSDASADLDVRALEDSLVLELSLPRQKELTASCPAIAFELLRAAGAVIAARGRTSERRAELAAN